MKMRHHRLLLFLLCLLSVSLGYAQKRTTQKQTSKSKTTAAKKIVETNPLYESMLDNTAKVMFIDSIVVAKDSFLYYIPLNKEAGEVSRSKGDAKYVNEFGNLMYIASGDSTSRHLAVSDLLGGQWSKPELLKGIENSFKEPDNPFMSSDGTTLYFAARGHESIGGYDIFTTIFDGDSAKFFTPENMGLPYNSRFNEYFMAIDDLDSLGWLVSDRYQPEGKVCVYTFVPTSSRKSFNEGTPEATLRRYADLRSIKDTRRFGDIDAALNRLTQLLQRNNEQGAESQDINFVIDDETTYHSLREFQSAEASKKYIQYREIMQSLAQEGNRLQQLRDDYAAKPSRQSASTITKLEQSVGQLQQDALAMAKSIRNAEIKKLLNK